MPLKSLKTWRYPFAQITLGERVKLDQTLSDVQLIIQCVVLCSL